MVPRIVTALLLVCFFGGGARSLRAEEPSTGHEEIIAMPTMGGKQFWADEHFFRGWRIQRNVLTSHCRLLDPNDRRHTWGTFDECRAKLDEIRREQKLRPMRGRAVVVLHGLMRSRESMAKLCKYLEENGHYTVVNVTYPSTRRGIGEHAKSLARLVDSLDGFDEINFIGHSMGNIVIRHYLGDQMAANPNKKLDRRFKRMVMLAPPNQGSRLATALADNGAFKVINSTPGKELGVDWATIKDRLAVPPFEFGVIAGGRGDEKGYNPVLPGDDDGTVRVATTHLTGETDFTIVPVLHSFLMGDQRVLECTLRFLQKGQFHRRKVTTKP